VLLAFIGTSWRASGTRQADSRTLPALQSRECRWAHPRPHGQVITIRGPSGGMLGCVGGVLCCAVVLSGGNASPTSAPILSHDAVDYFSAPSGRLALVPSRRRSPLNPNGATPVLPPGPTLHRHPTRAVCPAHPTPNLPLQAPACHPSHPPASLAPRTSHRPSPDHPRTSPPGTPPTVPVAPRTSHLARRNAL
jgi:hypothetical protein